MNNVSSSNSQKALVPELRFPEFSDGWESTKFADLFEFLSNNTLSRADLSDSGTVKNIHYGDVLIKFGDVVSAKDNTIPFIKDKAQLSKNTDYLKNGDIIIADTAEDDTVGKATEIQNISNESVVSGLHTIPCRAKERFASGFLGYYLNSSAYHSQLYPLMQGIKVTSISKGNISKTELKFPCVNEQGKIACMLSLIDKKIEAQKQMIDSLKLYKRGVENLYFSKKYNNHCRLKDILIERNEKSVKNNEHDVISSTKNGLFKQCDYFNKQASSEDTTGYKIIRLEQIVFSPQNLWMGNINYNDSYDIGIVSPSYKIFDINDGFDKYYIACLLKSSQAIKEYILASEQGASIVRRNLNMELFLQVAFFMPDLEEQIKISKHLKLLSNQLDNQEHTLKALLTMKQGLLQKMFI